ncbi:hypothetical protein V866_006152 [Kwoniella sp. B9012]
MQSSTLLSAILPFLLASTTAFAQDPTATSWPAASEGCDINVAQKLYSSHSAQLALGASTTVVVGFPTEGAAKPTDQCEDDGVNPQKRIIENGHAAYIAPTGGAYGMSK